MHRTMKPFLLVMVTAALSGCASAPQDTANPDVNVRRADRNLITADEIAGSGAITAQQAIERLRPHMLGGRATGSIRQGNQDQLHVYVDNQRFGGVDNLQSMQASEIHEIRYLSGVDATNRFGTGHSLGAILITRKRR
jgi:type IV pilus biogenesis protein CpaD/CtpE